MTTLKDTAPATSLTEVAPLAVKVATTHRLVVNHDPAGATAESIRAMRTHLLAQHVRDGRRSIAICAASRGVGCSFLAANLAAAIAQSGLKVLLIDANLRDPGLADYFRPEKPVVGLYQALVDPALAVGATVQEDVLPNLSLMFAGSSEPGAHEQLGNAAFKLLMEQCMRDYDLTIVDTPAANLFADARRIASVMRYAMVVVRRDQSFLRDVRTLIGDLRADRAHVIGTYLNDY
ncbi:MAG: CpsD/CapB family tyrosine-protein kinase [Sphingomonas sp.]|jgi:capsular exopolysaccharide synthesis family protein